MENKRNIKIIYQYDGSKFYGFQRQINKKTVQGEIEKVIFKTFSEKINLISSGRTDRGVHAIEQVSNFFIKKTIPLEVIKKQLNKNLNGEIKILEIHEIDPNFNSRFNAKKRTYLYLLKKDENISPFETNYITKLKEDIDVNELQEIMKSFIGKHDFSSFMKKDKVQRNKIREIYSIKCGYNEIYKYNKIEKEYFIKICGSSFLKTMVRIMVGTSLAIYFNKLEKEYILKNLKNPNENTKKILAPSEGLYLYKIEY